MLALGGLNVYITSYISYKQKWVKMDYGNFIEPLVYFVQSFFTMFSGYVENMFGSKMTMLIGTVIIQIGLVGLYFQQNFYLLYVFLILMAIGSGISLNIPSKNVCFYYPDQKGLMTSFLLVIAGLSSSAFAVLGEFIINPEEIVIETEHYPLKIAKRSKIYFLFCFINVSVVNYIAIHAYQAYNPATDAEPKKKKKSKKITDKEKDNEEKLEEGKVLISSGEDIKNPNRKVSRTSIFSEEESSSSSEEESEESSEEEEEKEDKKEGEEGGDTTVQRGGDVRKIFTNIRIYRNAYINSGSSFWLYFLTATFRTYIAIQKFNGTIQKYLYGSTTFSLVIFSPVFGFLADNVSFKKNIFGINSTNLIMCIYFFFLIQNEICFSIGIFVVQATFSAVWAIIPTHLMDIYGIRNMLVVDGFMALTEGFANVLSAGISIFVNSLCETPEEMKEVYRKTFLVLFGLAISGFIATCFEGMEVFDFGDKPKLPVEKKDKIKDEVNNMNVGKIFDEENNEQKEEKINDKEEE